MEGQARIMAAILILSSIILPLSSSQPGHKGLHVGFYTNSCPQAEEIVAEVVSEAYKKDPGIAAGLLRIFFHDCFVNGCDASLLLDSTPSGGKTEKQSPANGKFLRGFEIIDAAKERLERDCPEIVSCADILSFATRDGSVLSGVPHYQMPGGRRDGLISRAEDIPGNLPFFNSPIQQITELFVRKGLTQEELVVLTGAHSIGVAHCPTFAYRVNKYNDTFQTDPSLNAVDSANIKGACNREKMSSEEMEKTTLPFETNTPFKMDAIFYKQLLQGKWLIESDGSMAKDPGTRSIVKRLAENEERWLQMFGRAMSRLAGVDVKTGTEGEIRKQCRMLNSENKDNAGNAKDSGKSVADEDFIRSADVEDSGKDSKNSGNASFDVNSPFDSGNSLDSGDSSDFIHRLQSNFIDSLQ